MFAEFPFDEVGRIAVQIPVPERRRIEGIIELGQFVHVNANRCNAPRTMSAVFSAHL